MADSGGYVIKVHGKRGTGAPDEVLYIDLGYLVLAADNEHSIELVLENNERITLGGEDAAWVREILGEMVQPRKDERGYALIGGRR
jgi:hypothetical protein